MMIALFDQEYAVKQYGNTMKQESMAQGMAQGMTKRRIQKCARH